MKQLSEEKPSKTSLLPEYKVLRDYSLLTYTIVVGMTVSLILFFLVLNNDSKIEQAQFEERVRSELKFHSEALDRYAFRLAISSKIWKAAERTKTEFEESTDLKISEQEFPFGCLGSYSYSGDPGKNSVHWWQKKISNCDQFDLENVAYAHLNSVKKRNEPMQFSAHMISNEEGKPYFILFYSTGKAVKGATVGVVELSNLLASRSNLVESKVLAIGDQSVESFLMSKSEKTESDYENASKFHILEQNLKIDRTNVRVQYRMPVNSEKMSRGWIILLASFLVVIVVGGIQFTLVQRNSSIELEINRISGELMEVSESAIRANLAKTQFLAGVSHELRTPLNVILGLADLLLKTDLDSQQKKYSQILKHSGNHLLDLINDFLDIPKLEDGTVVIHQESLDILTLMEDISQILILKAIEKEVSYAHWIDLGLPEKILGDSTRIRQIIINLLVNAINYTPKGGSLQLNIRKVQVESEFKIEIRVIDSGIGISEKDIDRIFEPYFRADEKIRGAPGARGLGLYLVKTLVNLMGGEISVESRRGLGSDFKVILPLLPDSSDSLAQGLLKHFDSANGDTIPVATSDNVRMKYLSHIFESLNGKAEILNLTGDFGIDLDRVSSCFGKWKFPIVWDLSGYSLNTDLIIERMKNINSITDSKLLFIGMVNPGQLERVDEIHKELPWTKIIENPVSITQLLTLILTQKQVYEETPVFLSGLKTDLLNAPAVRALLVEDDVDSQYVLRTFLKNLGIEVTSASDGVEGIRLYEQTKVDIVITDLRMPRMSGEELTKTIRSGELKTVNSSDLPIIVLTADAQPELVNNLMKSQASLVLTKPISEKELRRGVSKFFELPRETAKTHS